jgi:hypothetical protein
MPVASDDASDDAAVLVMEHVKQSRVRGMRTCAYNGYSLSAPLVRREVELAVSGCFGFSSFLNLHSFKVAVARSLCTRAWASSLCAALE